MATEIEKCGVEKCKRPYRAKGFCNIHFKKWRRGEMPKKSRYKTCGEGDCRKPLFRRGICEEHYNAWLASRNAPAAGVPAAPVEAPVAEPEAK